MKYFFPLLLITIILSGILFAFKNTKRKPKNTLLWEIKHPNSKYTSYIFGTIHLIEKEYFHFPKLYIYLENDQDLLSYFTQEQNKVLLQWVEQNLHLNEQEFTESYGKFKPFILVQTITQFAFLDKTISYEREIVKIIKNQNIPIEGLETIENQINLFNILPMENQVNMIMQAIESTTKNQLILSQMQQAYKDQDLDRIHQLLLEESTLTSTDFNHFVTARNMQWIKPLTTYFSQGKTFVAVGAGHLAGENGILNLLRKEGYKTKAIYLK